MTVAVAIVAVVRAGVVMAARIVAVVMVIVVAMVRASIVMTTRIVAVVVVIVGVVVVVLVVAMDWPAVLVSSSLFVISWSLVSPVKYISIQSHTCQ